MDAPPGTDPLSPQHLAALEWFATNAGSEVPFSLPSELGLTTKAKGIYKPHWSPYALSVRVGLGSPYANSAVEESLGGMWRIGYSQEGAGEADLGLYTNRGLLACVRDSVPIGVLIQRRPKPDTTYFVLGLAYVLDWKEGFFTLSGPAAPIAGMSSLVDLERATVDLDTTGYFDPTSEEDARKQTLRSIAVRQGQAMFRANLLRAYQGRCAVTGFNVPFVLEAAHIRPYQGPKTNVVPNGLLLRADIHTLFDLGLLAVHEDGFRVELSPAIQGSPYDSIHGQILNLPASEDEYPNREALQIRRLAVR